MKSEADSLRNKFMHFLSVGRTKEQIREVFGKETNRLLAGDYKPLSVFAQKDDFNRKLYILLPLTQEGVEIKPKEWKYSIHNDEFGNHEPYLVVQLPPFKGKITIAPLFDVHYGNAAHKKQKFLSYIKWIERTPNVYAILGGDMMENATDDGRGMTYDQSENPESQLDYMVRNLAPIAHKILVSVPGNHEERTRKKSGTDVAKVLADALKVPYFTGPVLMDILVNGFRWTFYVSHGFGNSQTKGGKMNSASRPKTFTAMVHFFISGHVHDAVCERETILYPNPQTCRLEYRDQWVIIAPSFLAWNGTYAYRGGMKPGANGGVYIELNDNGDYRGVQT